ncbi:hypothetical protein [Roseateles sp. LYH14W]|uniref:Uncharacterized protein n=1 Tax=Pelomonas parva TaxID=3299032 RepID=A0ABW7F0I5_9BURK
MWRIEFSADKFLPILPEQCQTNPGAYGFELALWLAQRLLARGIVTSYPQGEDWGWFIEHTDADETEIQIGCASVASEGDGYANRAIEWSIFVKPYTSLRERLKGVTHAAKVEHVGRAILESLAAEGIPARHAPD